jgi:hypothetical protein
MNENRFFKDNENNYISVRDEVMAREAQRLGYNEIKVSHIMAIEQIPCPALANSLTVRPEQNPLVCPLPARLVLPQFGSLNGSLPPVYYKRDKKTPANAENYAIGIVRIWEDRVFWKERAFSPVKHWTKEKCQANGLKDSLVQWAKAYVAIKMVHRKKNLKEITVTSGQLFKDASKWAKENKNANEEWFDIAVQIATGIYKNQIAIPNGR